METTTTEQKDLAPRNEPETEAGRLKRLRLRLRSGREPAGKPGKKKRRWLAPALIAVLAVTAAGWYLRSGSSAKGGAAETVYTTAEAARRSVSQSLSGSGTLQPADSYTVTSLVSGEVTADYFAEGDTVEKGQVLYTLDASNASSSVTQAQLSYQQAVEAKYPKAAISGTVSQVYVSNGDSVGNGTAICDILGSNNLVIDFSFTYTSLSDFYTGQSAAVYISGFEGSVTGRVTAVSSSYVTTSNGMKLCTVRVEVDNPGLVTTDYTAQAVINGNYSYGDATISLGSTGTVYATGSGTVQGLSLLSGDLVTAGDRICTISSESIDNQITNAQLNLNNSQKTLDNYSVAAPIAGTVIEKNVKSGDNLNNSSSSAGMAVIYDLSYMKIELAVDELDISQVEVGQSVAITADAVEGSFTGTVSKVGVAGTTSGGVTTYPVTVVIQDYGDLRPGMNVNAEIVIAEAADALAVPNAAVNRGGTVLITADSPSAANALTEMTAPEGYVYVRVETGVSDDDYIQITDGLTEGDTVAYVQAAAESSGQMDVMMGGGMTMGGGSMPSGTMTAPPSGGGAPSGGGGFPG